MNAQAAGHDDAITFADRFQHIERQLAKRTDGIPIGVVIDLDGLGTVEMALRREQSKTNHGEFPLMPR